MIISGKEISVKIKDELKEEVEKLVKEGKRINQLVVIGVGDNQNLKLLEKILVSLKMN